jgi:hypothetical protein
MSAEYRAQPPDWLHREKAGQLDPAELWFRNGLVLHPRSGLDPALALPLEGNLIVQFPGEIRIDDRAFLGELGVEIRDYVQNNAYLASIPSSASEPLMRAVDSGRIRYIGPYPLGAKFDSDLLDGGESETRISVVFVEPPSIAEHAMLEVQMQIEQRQLHPRPVFRGKLSSNDIEALAASDNVKWIERYQPGRLHNLEASISGGASTVNDLRITGADVRVAVVDSGIARTGSDAECGATGAGYHPDLPASRIDDEWDFYDWGSNACDKHGHGTHVSGIIGGQGSLEPEWTGIAPGVTYLIYRDCCNALGQGFQNFHDVLVRAAAHDADIVGNSWGGSPNFYTTASADADDAVLGLYDGSDGQPHPMVLTVSSGNDADLTGAPATGKNVIAVGAMKDGNWGLEYQCWYTYNCDGGPCGCIPDPQCGDHFWPADELICFSNTGPVDTDSDGHGRVKPDVVAPGARIVSTAAFYQAAENALYEPRDGTSMSQPVVAGTAALMLDAHRGIREYPEMLKVRLLATAIDLHDIDSFGHGMVDALHAVYDSDTQRTAHWERATITGTGFARDHVFEISSGYEEVRVYLTWLDPSSDTTETVNDLDLRVYDGGGALVGASSSWDDNVEWLRLDYGEHGVWRAEVSGYNVPQPDVRYAIIALEIGAGPALRVTADPQPACGRPGSLVAIGTTLGNGGQPVAASNTSLVIGDPGTLALDSVILHASPDGRAHLYHEGDIHPDAGAYTLYQGMTTQDVLRRATWHLSIDPTAPDGVSPITFSGTAHAQSPVIAEAVITVDTVAPEGPFDLASISHSFEECSGQPTATMTWGPAEDPCGIDGYGLHWSQNAPELPLDVKRIDDVTSYTWTLNGSADPYFFNLRAVDTAGNWAPGFAHWGPVWIDTGGPGVATDLHSPTHPLFSCTEQNTVALGWSGTFDDVCGLGGYSVSWSEIHPALPDAVQDLGVVDDYEGAIDPANTERFFNIRAVDVVGNWAPEYASYGPFVVDARPAAVPGLALAPLDNHLALSWSPGIDADGYRVYRDTDPRFSSPTQVGGDVLPTSIIESNGMLDPAPLVFYRVVGLNICGHEGP